MFYEIVIAPSYTSDGLEVLKVRTRGGGGARCDTYLSYMFGGEGGEVGPIL
jgi:hypothetical protein